MYRFRVFHDIEADGFNIDHVAVGPGGLFVIETKARSKPTKDAVVEYDGSRVLVGGHTPDRDPVAQARACADHVAKRVREVTGQAVPVRPVVLFPDWFVNEGPRGSKVWVLNPARFLGYVRHERRVLSEDDVRRVAAILADLARLAVRN